MARDLVTVELLEFGLARGSSLLGFSCYRSRLMFEGIGYIRIVPNGSALMEVLLIGITRDNFVKLPFARQWKKKALFIVMREVLCNNMSRSSNSW